MKTSTHRYPRVLRFSLYLLLVLASCAAPGRAPDAEPPSGGTVVTFSLTGDTSQPLENGAVLKVSEHSALSLTAHTEPAEVGSVRFRLGALEHTANATPYTLALGRSWPLEPGDYTLSATPYSQEDGQGEAGESLTLGFSVAADSSETPPPTVRQQLKYVIVDDGIHIHDMGDGYRLLRTVEVPEEVGMRRPRGVSAHAETGRLFVSYWSDLPRRGFGYLLAFDLLTDEVVWVKTFEPSIDTPEVSPDGQTLYMGCGEERSDCDWWFVIDAATGEIKDKISVFVGPHNTIVSSRGDRVYLASLKYNYLSVADTSTNKVIYRIGPFSNSIRPFTLNAAETLTFVTVDFLSGFEIGDLRTGEVLYSVQVQGFPWEDPKLPITQSHGIALSPDEREVWVVDGHNRYLHIFDITRLPEEAPEQIASVALNGLPKWINFSRDGHFVHISSGEIVDAATREIVTHVAESRYFIQIDFEDGLPVQAYSRYGLGYRGD